MSTPSTARKYSCSIVSSGPLAANLQRIRLSCPELARTIRPGQFMNLAVPGDPSEILRLPFGYTEADPASGEVEIAVDILGSGTHRLAGLPVGTVSDLLGPAGNGWTILPQAKRCLIFGVVAGIAPMMPLLQAYAAAGVACDVVQIAEHPDRVIYADEIADLGAAMSTLCGDNSFVAIDDITSLVADLIASHSYDMVYACSNDFIMSVVAGLAADAGIPCEVSMSRLMACGFGACTTCLVDTVDGRKGVCTEGPIFDAKKVIW